MGKKKATGFDASSQASRDTLGMEQIRVQTVWQLEYCRESNKGSNYKCSAYRQLVVHRVGNRKPFMSQERHACLLAGSCICKSGNVCNVTNTRVVKCLNCGSKWKLLLN